MNDVKTLIETYSKNYCEFLEAAYGRNMLSDGGTVAIDRLLDNHALYNKKVLDVGAGIGGVAFYVAERYQAHVIGLELGADMVAEATQRTPKHLEQQVHFQTYIPPYLTFPSHSFDLVYSKGVFCHIQNKLPLFTEIFRVLKQGSYFLMTDWLSPVQNQWDTHLSKMYEMENLIIYAETEKSYRQALSSAGFQQIEIRDENMAYTSYNEDIINHLKKPENIKAIKEKFGEVAYQEAIEGYQLIVDSMKNNELLMRWIGCRKI